METKQCPKCGEVKELNKDNFILTTNRGKPYWIAQCRACVKARRQARKPTTPRLPSPVSTMEDGKEGKQCSKCGEVKELNKVNFIPKNWKGKIGWLGECRACWNVRQDGYRRARRGNPKTWSERVADWSNETTLQCSKCGEVKELNKDNFIPFPRKNGGNGWNQGCRACKAKERQGHRKRYTKDPVFRLRENVTNAVRRGLQGLKNNSTFVHLPYTPEQLKEHIESQFEDWMTWDNWGVASHDRKTWNIDHIYPQSRLPYDSFDHPNFLKCWGLENLRPLEAFANISKSDKLL